MKRGVWIAVFFVAGMPQGLFAAEDHLNTQQQLGRRLFEQSCGVCHTRPTLIVRHVWSGTFENQFGRTGRATAHVHQQRHRAHARLQIHLHA